MASYSLISISTPGAISNVSVPQHLISRIYNIYQAFMRANFKCSRASLSMNVNNNRKFIDLRWQRNRAKYPCSRLLCRIHNLIAD